MATTPSPVGASPHSPAARGGESAERRTRARANQVFPAIRMADNYVEGMRVLYRNMYCTVRVVAEEVHFAPGLWIGVEIDEGEGEGKNDGSVEGVRYFDCPPGRGLFVRPRHLEVVAFPGTPKSRSLSSSPDSRYRAYRASATASPAGAGSQGAGASPSLGASFSLETVGYSSLLSGGGSAGASDSRPAGPSRRGGGGGGGGVLAPAVASNGPVRLGGAAHQRGGRSEADDRQQLSGSFESGWDNYGLGGAGSAGNGVAVGSDGELDLDRLISGIDADVADVDAELRALGIDVDALNRTDDSAIAANAHLPPAAAPGAAYEIADVLEVPDGPYRRGDDTDLSPLPTAASLTSPERAAVLRSSPDVHVSPGGGVEIRGEDMGDLHDLLCVYLVDSRRFEEGVAQKVATRLTDDFSAMERGPSLLRTFLVAASPKRLDEEIDRVIFDIIRAV